MFAVRRIGGVSGPGCVDLCVKKTTSTAFENPICLDYRKTKMCPLICNYQIKSENQVSSFLPLTSMIR